MSSLTSESAVRETILRLARKLPTTPHIFGRLGRLLNDINSDLDSIVKLVSVDSGLTARVIRLSNSVFFRGDQPVKSLDEAINRVGFREMHRIVGVAISEQIFQGGLPVYHLSAEQVWENAVVTALSMERVARAVGEDDAEAYTIGMLRPVGKLVLDLLLQVEQPGVACPESETLDLPKWERAWAAITSNEAGAMILEEWKMSPAVCTGVRDHYKPTEETGRMGAMLHVACWMTNELGKGIQAELRQWELTPETLNFAGLTAEQAQVAVAETQEALNELKNRLKGGSK
ncbi:MAG TPA: HDOD domain-containing protein [Opitutaceae bacterium]|nr:HDOD domain-containing protein [Opitutaceae bacterium]